jgi:hypothetical protein
MHSPCIRVDGFLSACEYTSRIPSTGSHPNTSLLCSHWTPTRTLRLSHIRATSARSACTLCAELPRRTAVHFFPHTRPPDTHSHLSQQHTTPSLDCGAAFEYQGSLVNTYFSLVLSSMPGRQCRAGNQRASARLVIRRAVEIESLQLSLWTLGLVWFIVTFHDVPFQ